MVCIVALHLTRSVDLSLFFLMSCPRLSFPSSLLFFCLLAFFFGWVTDWLHFLFICPYPISFSAAAFHPFLSKHFTHFLSHYLSRVSLVHIDIDLSLPFFVTIIHFILTLLEKQTWENPKIIFFYIIHPFHLHVLCLYCWISYDSLCPSLVKLKLIYSYLRIHLGQRGQAPSLRPVKEVNYATMCSTAGSETRNNLQHQHDCTFLVDGICIGFSSKSKL